MARQLDVDVSRVASELPALSRAAMWFRLMSGSLRRVPPSKRDITLKGIRQQAEKLGAKLIAANQAAHGLLTKLDAKRIGGDADELPVSDLTVVLGLVADANEVSAWMEMTKRISEAVSDATRVLTGRGRGNPSEREKSDAAAVASAIRGGDFEPNYEWATDAWFRTLVGIYETITGRRATRSVGTSTSTGMHAGQAGGPFIEFLLIVQKDVGLTLSGEAWASRLQRL